MMNSENIYGQKTIDWQQQQMNQATLNGNSFPQDQLSSGVASMTLNAPPKYPPPTQQQQQHFPTQLPPPPNQNVHSMNGVNNNIHENNFKNPIGSNAPSLPYQGQIKPNISYPPGSSVEAKSSNMPPVQQTHPQQSPQVMPTSYMQRPYGGQPELNSVPNQPQLPPMSAQNVNYMAQQNIGPQQNQNTNFPKPIPGGMENKSTGVPPPPMINQNVPAGPSSASSFSPPPASIAGFSPGPPPGTGFPPAPPNIMGFPPAPPNAAGFPPAPANAAGFPPAPQNTYMNDQMARSMPPQSGQRYPNLPGTMTQSSMQSSSYQPQPLPIGHQQRNFNQPPGVYGGPYQQAPAAQRRLDPDQMPNPIQVIVENQKQCGGVFVTNQAGLLPPLVTTQYVTQDQGNCSPRFVRSTLYNVPATADTLKQTALPFSLIISPFARTIENELEPPIVDFGEIGPIRCIRCKAYMSPNMQFIDAGRRFQCLLCKATTEVPTEYFQHLDHTGQRVDKYERPELVLGTYEFVATGDYCRDNIIPNPPAFIFVIDVSYNNVKSGLVHLLCRNIKQIISNLPVDKGQERTKMKVGFITYNHVVHFYNIKSTLAQPQMMVVGDTQEMFMPLLDGFLCDPEESSAVIDALMEQIPIMFGDTKETETILLPAIQAGLEALKASNCPGKLLVFNSSLPIAEAPGKLRNRDDRKLLGTEKEKTILTPQNQAYNNLGQNCVQAGCSVDLFIFNNSYIDIATIGQVSRLTGGEVYKYTYFQADIDGERLIRDICENIARPIAFDGVMRVRTSAGVRPTDFYGHFFMSNTTDLELASIDCNKAVAIEIKHDDKLAPEDNVYIQVALLYTSCGGQRRLRIMNLALKTTTQISEVFRSCDLDATILYFAKQSMFKLMELTPKAIKENLIHRSAQILACYRKNCTSPTSAGQLILPECLKLLPLYISCMIKNDAISGGSDMSCDDRSYVIQFVLAMDLPMSVFHIYPRLIPIHNIDVNESEIPLPIRCTYEKMHEDGAYILENGIHMFIWIGLAVSPEFLKALFGVQSTQQVNAERFQLSQVPDSPLAMRIKQLIDTIKIQRSRCMRVTLVKQNDKLESVFKHYLVEDRGADGSASYVDFLCHMHKEIKELLS